jgi:UPF0755 protein
MDKTSMKYKKKRINRLYAGIVYVSALFFLTVMGGYVSYGYIANVVDRSNDEAGISVPAGEGMELDIPMGSSTEDIALMLKEKGIIKYPLVYKILSKINGYDGKYRSGIHVINKNADYNSLRGYDDLMRILIDKPLDNPTISVTIPEGYTYLQIRRLLDEKELVEPEELDRAVNEESFDYPFLESIPEGRIPRLEGYLFPETYIFDTKKGARHIVEKLLDQFNHIFPETYRKRAEELGMTTDEIIILASIVEREVQSDEERDIIAGIFYKRLKSSDPTLNFLQSCATIQYIYLNTTGEIKEQITQEDTQIDHPYNTYKYPGLPPGPICNPGLKSIRAALFPEETDYLYFVAKGDGTHHFSKTYNEHVNAMHRYGQILE